MTAELGGRSFDVAEVRGSLAERGGDGDDGDVEASEVGGVGTGPQRAIGEQGGQAVVADVLDVGRTGGELADAGLVEVVADDLVALLGGPDRKRKPDVALAHDDHALAVPVRAGGHLLAGAPYHRALQGQRLAATLRHTGRGRWRSTAKT